MINKVILVGRAGKDPELHTTKSDKKVVRFSLATWENYKDEKSETGWRQETEWHNVVIWGAAAETIAKNVKKGSMVYVEGSIRTRSYEDKEGATKWITEVIGFGRAILPKREPAPEEHEAQEKKEEDIPAEPLNKIDEMMNESDMPF